MIGSRLYNVKLVKRRLYNNAKLKEKSAKIDTIAAWEIADEKVSLKQLILFKS